MNEYYRDALVEYGRSFAISVLQKHGEFHPFGAAVQSDDTVTGIGAWNGEELPNPKDIVRLLSNSLQDEMRSGRYKLGLVVCNGFMQTDTGKSAAIVMYILMPNGTYDKVEFPYSASPLR